MEVFFESIQHFLDPNWILQNGGLYLVLAILFIETGLFIGFFLPGDPLLFVAGMVLGSANQVHEPFANELLNVAFWMLLFSGSTILGYYTGYWFGKRFGHILQTKKDSWIFKRKYIDAAHEFYERKGGFAIAISRFLPIVRTFAPIIAGTVGMNYKKFSFYNIVGGIIWVVSITSLGYVLGDSPWVMKNLELVIIGLVLVVTLPVLSKMIFKKGSTIS